MVFGLPRSHPEDDLELNKSFNLYKEFGLSFTHLDEGIEGLHVDVCLLEVTLDFEAVLEDPRLGCSHFAAAESSVSICGARGDQLPLVPGLGVELHRHLVSG